MRLTTIIATALVALMFTSCACGDRRGRGGHSSSRRPRTSATATQPAPQTPSTPSAPPAVAIPTPETGEMSGSEVFAKYNSAVFTVWTERAQGSGFFVSSDGLAVSNWHVFSGSNSYQVQTSDGDLYGVDKIVAKDAEADYVVFRVKHDAGKTFNFLPRGNRNYRVGDKVYAIGSPKGYTNTLSSGDISQIRNGDKYSIQINVPTDHGSSGGALINTYGEVIGITSAGVDNSNANLNFAIDIRKLSRWLK